MSGTGWIARLYLEPHPEGGWFRRIHTDSQLIDTPQGPRPRATSIHYLLSSDQPIGRLHRNRSGILHFLQDGGPVEYIVVRPDGVLQRTVLGFEDGAALTLFVPGGCWKASRLLGDVPHALVSEVVTPGFDICGSHLRHPRRAPARMSATSGNTDRVLARALIPETLAQAEYRPTSLLGQSAQARVRVYRMRMIDEPQ